MILAYTDGEMVVAEQLLAYEPDAVRSQPRGFGPRKGKRGDGLAVNQEGHAVALHAHAHAVPPVAGEG